MNKLIGLCAVASVLYGCGGGGGGGDTAPAAAPVAATYSLTSPSKLTGVPTLGATSFPISVTDYGQGTISFPAESWKDTILSSGNDASAIAASSPVTQLFPITHLNDTNATNAWSNGWTGKGTNITIIDDFTTTSISLSPQSAVTVNRGKAYSNYTGTYTANYDVNYSINQNVAHGTLVARIAGGNYDGALNTGTVSFLYSSSTLKTCAASPNLFYTLTCNSSFYGWGPGHTTTSQAYSYKAVARIAKEALITKDNVNLSSSQNATQTVTYIQGHLANSVLSDVVNLSLGYNIPTTGLTFDSIMGTVLSSPLPTKLNSVIVVAAGNSGSPCATNDLAGCNAEAVAMAFQDATKDSTIIAGALEGTGSSENIATYSTRAGILASRFLLAPGTTGYSGVVGTSFAAPRISGAAAIIKQKYPNLTAKQIADVLLLSANKDINNSGVPSFSGAHPVYGQGKLDLQAALALASSL